MSMAAGASAVATRPEMDDVPARSRLHGARDALPRVAGGAIPSGVIAGGGVQVEAAAASRDFSAREAPSAERDVRTQEVTIDGKAYMEFVAAIVSETASTTSFKKNFRLRVNMLKHLDLKETQNRIKKVSLDPHFLDFLKDNCES